METYEFPGNFPDNFGNITFWTYGGAANSERIVHHYADGKLSVALPWEKGSKLIKFPDKKRFIFQELWTPDVGMPKKNYRIRLWYGGFDKHGPFVNRFDRDVEVYTAGMGYIPHSRYPEEFDRSLQPSLMRNLPRSWKVGEPINYRFIWALPLTNEHITLLKRMLRVLLDYRLKITDKNNNPRAREYLFGSGRNSFQGASSTEFELNGTEYHIVKGVIGKEVIDDFPKMKFVPLLDLSQGHYLVGKSPIMDDAF